MIKAAWMSGEMFEKASGAPPGRPVARMPADPERLIAIGRLLISTFGFAAIHLDPTQPANLVDSAYWILIGYVIWSVLLLFARPPRRFAFAYELMTTAIDVCIVAVLADMTGELESPFFTFYTFLLISAAIRWEWAGTLLIAAILQTILLTIGVPDVEDGESELNILIIRSIFCWVIVLLLGYFGSYRDRSNRRLRELADWPHDMLPEDDHPWLSSALRHASSVLGANSIAVLWRDRDQPQHHAALWHGQSCHFTDHVEVPGAYFVLNGSSALELDEGRSKQVLEGLASQLGVAGLCWRNLFASGFRTIRFEGSVIVADPAHLDRDMMLLTQIVASRIAIELEQFSLVREYASAAGLKERIRIARDLHDSILQDLTAAVLQIDAAQRADPEGAETLARIRDTLRANQRKLRLLVDDARQRLSQRARLADQLQMFVGPLGSQWGCKLHLEIEPPDLFVSEAIAAELCLALSEATANAARHGGATQVSVSVTQTGDQLSISIEDDGKGGDVDMLPHPASIDMRVRELGGTLAVQRKPVGVKLQLAIPLATGVAA